ncbi:MAG: 16S rRNA (guanine(966)-N(2))-methyltransferase RsmD [Endozoicomonas sp. (ex Botrylloides leachii)]|nr:16S rRNA (guanine(966)-N(2))-methyltransferase RsmD [Endozoicomonas sp. (ex Botrylloides leachii)]
MRRKNDGCHGGSSGLRIISGQWRGRKLPVANVKGLRPTPDRVRETVFNWLAPYIVDAKVLDCFSGSGALALEALSRGAASAIMLEKATPAVKILNNNIALLSATQASVINTDALSWLNQPAEAAFDIVFLDPPFSKQLLLKTCQLLSKQGYIVAGSIIYIEAENTLSLTGMPPQWHLFKEKNAGQIRYTLWQVKVPMGYPL